MNWKTETIEVNQDSRVDKLKVRMWRIKVELSKLGIEKPWVWYREWVTGDGEITHGMGIMWTGSEGGISRLKSKFHRVYNLNGTDETITRNLETMIEDLKKG